SFDVVKKNVRLAKLRVGAIVGEIAFYTGAARTASIIAARDGVVLAFHKDALARLRAEHPELATKFDLMVIRKVSCALSRPSTLLTMVKYFGTPAVAPELDYGFRQRGLGVRRGFHA